MNSGHRTLIISAFFAASIVLFFPKSTSFHVARKLASNALKPAVDVDCVMDALQSTEARTLLSREATKRLELLDEIAVQPLSKYVAMSDIRKLNFKGQTVKVRVPSGSEEDNLRNAVERFLSNLSDSVTDLHSILKSKDVPIPAEAQLFEAQIRDTLDAFVQERAWIDDELADIVRTGNLENTNVALVGRKLVDRVLVVNGKAVLEGTRLQRLKGFTRQVFDNWTTEKAWKKRRKTLKKFYTQKLPEYYAKNGHFWGSIAFAGYVAPRLVEKFRGVNDPQSELEKRAKEFWQAPHRLNATITNRDEAARIHKAWEKIESTLSRIVTGEITDTSGELTLKLQDLGAEFRALFPDIRLYEPFSQTEDSRNYLIQSRINDFQEKEAALQSLLKSPRTDAVYLTTLDLAKQEFAHAAAARFLSHLFETREEKNMALQNARAVHDAAINLAKDPKLLYSALYLQSKLSRKEWKSRFESLDKLAGRK